MVGKLLLAGSMTLYIPVDGRLDERNLLRAVCTACWCYREQVPARLFRTDAAARNPTASQ